MTPAEAKQALLDSLTVERFTTHQPQPIAPTTREETTEAQVEHVRRLRLITHPRKAAS